MEVLLTFSTTHNTLAAEDLLRKADIEMVIIPTPRDISANCGLSIRISRQDLERGQALFDKAGISRPNVYLAPQQKKGKHVRWEESSDTV